MMGAVLSTPSIPQTLRFRVTDIWGATQGFPPLSPMPMSPYRNPRIGLYAFDSLLRAGI